MSRTDRITPASRLTAARPSRRTALAGGALTALALPAIAACSNEGRGGGDVDQTVDESLLPTFTAVSGGAEPDLIGENGVADAYFSYPADVTDATDGAPGDGDPITTMGITNSPIPPSLGSNEYWQELNERLGSELTINISNPADYNEKFPTAVAGGQLPDIWGVGSAPQMPQLLESEALDLTPYLSQDAISAYPNLANLPTEAWRSTIYNGKIFTVPVPRGVTSTYITYGRNDLLAEKGIDTAPASWDEFVSICEEMTDAGSNRWALSRVPTDYVCQMHEIPNGWSVVDGKLVSANEHEAQKDALEATRSLVEKGYTHPDTFGAQWQEYKLWLINGTTSFTFDTFSGWSSYTALSTGDDTVDLGLFPTPLLDGGGLAPAWLGSPINSVTAISKGSEARVETLLKFLNYLASPFGSTEHKFLKYGLEGVHHELEGTDPVLNDKGKSETALGIVYFTDAPAPIYTPGDPDATQLQYDAQMQMATTAVSNPVRGLYSETDSSKGGQIGKALADLRNDILQGREKVSAWDDAVADWKKKGGDAIRDEYQEAYDSLESAS
ncbi:hypothetical protein ACXET9_15125 [Brachybacterium sp. DNPG3]